VKTYPNWRLIEDPDGTRGWMLVTLLSDRRTAIVKPGAPRQIHERADDTSRVSFLAEPGVVGRIDKCSDGWCRIKVGKREGRIHTSDIWGVSEGEEIE
jgi:SH3-like domain-containing protein